MKMKLLSLLFIGVAKASVFANFQNAGVEPVTEAPASKIPATPPVVPVNTAGFWINCQPIRIDEGIWDHQRLTHLDLPQVWFTNDDACQYELVGPAAALDYFSLVQSKNPEGKAAGSITLIKRLDREVQDVHSIEVAALTCAGAELQRREIQIVVGDINDHVPWIDAGSLHMELCDDTKIDTVLGSLRGSDSDLGAYADLLYQFTYRKPYGTQIIVTRWNGDIEMLPNIFALNGKTGEVRLVIQDPRIDNTVKTIGVEVAVRDHPGNPIYGQRTAELTFTWCNQPPKPVRCNLGEVSENAKAGTLFTGTDILVSDVDSNPSNTVVGFEVGPIGEGAIEIEPVRNDDGTTSAVVKVVKPLNFETVEGDTTDGKRKLASIPVTFTNPRSEPLVSSEGTCYMTIIDEDDPPIFAASRMGALGIGVYEECSGQCTDISNGVVFATDEDTETTFTYSSNDPFFEVSNSGNKASICNTKALDREKHCEERHPDEPCRRFYPLLITATSSALSEVTSVIYIECYDINDNYPVVTMSPVPYNDVVCMELDRLFADNEFLKSHDIHDVNVTSYDGVDGKEIVAIALVEDPDDPCSGHTFPYTFNFTSDNHEEFEMIATNNKAVYLVAFHGERSMLESKEIIAFTVSDNGLNDQFDMTSTCAPDLVQPRTQIVNGKAFEHTLYTCECEGQDDDHYYPRDDECSNIGIAGPWWLALLALFLLLLLCLLGFCCCKSCCAPAPIIAAGEKETTYVYKYEKPDWYYYLYNLMTVSGKTDIAVDNATVDHPPDMCGVLDKSKEEADKVFHTYDEKRIYNVEAVPTEKAPLINNRLSMVSGVTGLSGMTDNTVNNQPTGNLNWNDLLHGVPQIKQIEVPGRPQSALSNVTDVTVNENKIKILRNHHLIANSLNRRAPVVAATIPEVSAVHGTSTVIGNSTILNNSTNLNNSNNINLDVDATNRSFYSQDANLHRSPSRISNAAENDLRFGTARSVDVLQRARSPVASLRHTENRIIYNEENLHSETDSEIGNDMEITYADARAGNGRAGSGTVV